MSVYEREWYRKEHERRQHRQEAADAMWNEVEPSHRKKRPSEKQTVSEKLILTTCPHCDFRFQVRVSLKRLNSYGYTCPSCKKKVTVRTESASNKVLKTILYIVGIPAGFLIILSSLQNFFPNILNVVNNLQSVFPSISNFFNSLGL